MPSRRDLFVREVGPVAKGSKPGMDWWAHMPEKSGIDAAVAAACPKSGGAAPAANIISERKFRRRSMLSALSWSATRIMRLAPALQVSKIRLVGSGDRHVFF